MLFGPSKLPQLGSGLGKAIRDFKKGISSGEIEICPRNSRKKFRNLNPAKTAPAFFINGKMLVGAQPLENFVRVIDDELARTH